ncbi:hypothetical protein [Micromonospora sp. WMMD987]|uniref:hypothetical protein n=1 Tax=Micromonospora TaxID=1873 RepID=UPI00249A63E5|nr:hypothetical protein [Micromonospora sp. WMMD987]WFE93484.1 hypothetical protein O7612_18915 [Micromonospora sp. WMMD987]
MRIRVALVAVGLLTMGYAVVGALVDPDLSPAGVLLFLAGVLVGHDLVWMLGLSAVGALLARFVPHRHRPLARIAAISAATVTVVALPLVLGFGRSPDNPSALPLPYGRNLAVVLLLVVAATALSWLWRDRRHRLRAGGKDSERPGGSGPPPAGR